VNETECWMLFSIVLAIGMYFLGRADGRLDEQEKRMFEKLDSLIARIPPLGDRKESQ
jgi:hypothetical protein